VYQLDPKTHKKPTECTSVFMMYFIHKILTNMFRPGFRPSSGEFSLYQNTVVVTHQHRILKCILLVSYIFK